MKFLLKIFGNWIFIIILFFFNIGIYAQTNISSLWSDIDETNLQNKKRVIPRQYRGLSLKIELLNKILEFAPREFKSKSDREIRLELPLPGGEFASFRIFESPVMEEGLGAKYPELKTYRGEGLTNGVYYTRFDLTPSGFHAIIRTNDGTVYIDPYSTEDRDTYISYYKSDYLPNESNSFFCLTENELSEETRKNIMRANYSVGEELRVYRLALAATGEYTIFHGGTVTAGLNAVVVALNRVNMIYEVEVSIRMVLVANNDVLIYTDPETDPYTDGNEYQMMNENQSNLDAVIGNGNYDIGHVFGVQGSSVAEPYVVCKTGLKARGVTELEEPTGDPFYVDHVAHEIGHQFGASHSFNGDEAACNGGGNSSTAYEPGSGSTIMSYSGTCGSQNIQINSDDYFHGISQDEIIAYSTGGSGNSCPTIFQTGNNPPLVTVSSEEYNIPKSTPFSLSGSAADPDKDTLTYCWEEFDLGPTGHPNFPSGNAPIFRTFQPVASSTRVFPRIYDIINNTQTIGEILPDYSRDLTFRLTLRDNRGGVSKSSDVSISVEGSAGPFVVTSPNTNVFWPGNTQQTITWNIANTNIPPVNCLFVYILLSSDGGLTYPDTLLSDTPNDGSEVVLIPDSQTDSARIKVQAADNVFFDISDTNFSIVKPVAIELISFSSVVERNKVKLTWDVGSEIDNYGFEIERALLNNNILTRWESIGFVSAINTRNFINHYAFIDLIREPGIYIYRLKIIDTSGQFDYSNEIKVIINAPLDHFLSQNFPNPFNPSTFINYHLPKKQFVILKVYDALGLEVITLINEEKEPGFHEVSFDGSLYSSGIYYYKLQSGDFIQTNKMLLLK